MDSPLRGRTSGYLAIVVAAILFGAWPSAADFVLDDVHPITLTILIQGIPGLLMVPWLRRFRVSRRDAVLLLGTAVAGGALAPASYFFGLERTTPANAVLLSNTEAFFTMIFAFVLLKERMNPRGYPAFGGIAAGAFVVTTDLRLGDVSFLPHLVGNLLLVVSAVFWALNNVGSTVLLRRLRILPLLSLQFLLGSGLLVPFALAARGPFAVGPEDAPFLLLLAVGGIGVFAVLFFHAFRTIGAMRSGAVLSTSALWGVLLAYFLFPGETLSPTQLAGGAVMLGSLIALYFLGERGAPTSAPVETLKAAPSDGPRPP